MTIQWGMEETRANINRRFGTAQFKLARASIASSVARLDYAKYHYSEVSRLLKRFSKKYLSVEPLVAVVSGEVHIRRQFEIFMMKTNAHSIACIQSIHAIPDLMAHSIYFSLGFNLLPQPLPPEKVSAFTVMDLLKKTVAHRQSRDILRAFCADDPAFRHVAALANIAKHRSVASARLNEDSTGAREDRHEIHFAAFAYEGRSFPNAKLLTVLVPAFEAASRCVVDSGIEINRLYEIGAV